MELTDEEKAIINTAFLTLDSEMDKGDGYNLLRYHGVAIPIATGDDDVDDQALEDFDIHGRIQSIWTKLTE